MGHKLFTYGILRPTPDEPALARNVTIPATMVDLGAFPAVLQLGGIYTTTGDVIEIDQATLAQYDKIEGVPTLYKRQTIDIPDIGAVYIYVYQHANYNRPIKEWRR